MKIKHRLLAAVLSVCYATMALPLSVFSSNPADIPEQVAFFGKNDVQIRGLQLDSAQNRD